MASQYISILVNKVTLSRQLPIRIGPYIVRIMTVRNKTDLLGIGLVRDGDPCLKSNTPDFILTIIPKRHKGPCKLVLTQPVQHIGLVLGCIPGCLYRISTVIFLHDIGIMTGCHIVSPQHIGVIEHPFPFDRPVAHNTWIRSQALKVFLYKGIGYIFLKL